MKLKASLLAIVASFFTTGFTTAQLDQVDLPIDYESSTMNYTVTDFGGNALRWWLIQKTQTTVALIRKVYRCSFLGRYYISTPAGLASFIPVTNEFATVTIRVYTPSAGIPILF